MNKNHCILCVADWNLQEKYYSAPGNLVEEFLLKIKQEGISVAWEWWTNQVNYGDKAGIDMPITYLSEIPTSDIGGDFFLDYNDPMDNIDWTLIELMEWNKA